MHFFQVKFKWLSSIDGKLKRITEKHIIQASSCSLVLLITNRLYGASSPGFEILLIKISNINDVFLQKRE